MRRVTTEGSPMLDRPNCLKVQGLSVRFPGIDRPLTVRDLSIELQRGKIVGLAGESGCGKSTSALAMIGFNRAGESVTGVSLFDGADLLQQTPEQKRRLWGNRICYVPQSASLALNPALTVGHQLAQPLAQHVGLAGQALERRKVELFELVDIPDPKHALDRYPFEFSGGQQQRIVLAVALSCSPDVLILDEPTTGLDVTTQARITKLLRTVVEQSNLAMLYVSHDLALLRGLADELAIMYAGEIVEQGPSSIVVSQPAHPYTKLLLRLSPQVEDPRLIPGIPGIPPVGAVLDKCAFEPRCPYAADDCRIAAVPARAFMDHQLVRCIRAEALSSEDPQPIRLASASETSNQRRLLTVDRVSLRYDEFTAVDRVSFSLHQGERVGIVGETGSGKSSVLKMIAGLTAPSEGRVSFDDAELAPRAVKRSRDVCRDIQLIFQNPDASLNPRHTIRRILTRPLELFRSELSQREQSAELHTRLDQVRLPTSVLERMPADLSGGQRQRIAIARAFLAKPRLLLCDEITSALDVSVQAAVLQLIAELSAREGTAVLLVSHDLALVRTLADRTIVMRRGRIEEEQPSDLLFSDPQADYTRELLAAIPRLHPR